MYSICKIFKVIPRYPKDCSVCSHETWIATINSLTSVTKLASKDLFSHKIICFFILSISVVQEIFI